MTQRIIGLSAITAMLKNINPIDRRPLERIGIFKTTSNWELMHWYVSRLGGLNIETASDGEILSLQEEFVALIRTCLRHRSPNPPSRQEIKEFQRVVRKHLTELADKGVTALPPMIPVFANPKFLAERQSIKEGPGIEIPDRFFMWATLDGVAGVGTQTQSLLQHLAELLQEFQTSVRRCPYCSKLFLQLRRNAVYCDRACQSVAIMKQLRQNERSLGRRSNSTASQSSKRRKKGAKR
jgi:hypothetical protein